MNNWIETDEFQRVLKINDTTFRIINGFCVDNDYYWLSDLEINLNDYSKQEIENHVIGYYESMEHLKSSYKESEHNQVIAEIISENEAQCDYSFNNENDLLIEIEKLINH